MPQNIIHKSSFVLLAALCALPFISSWMALIGGIIFSLSFSNPYKDITPQITSRMLAACIIGLGAGLSLHDVLNIGLSGLITTFITISLSLIIGIALGKLCKVSHDTSLLISIGTAICGGSAIAAAAPVLRAKQDAIAISLALVFALNAIALLIFPLVGYMLGLSQSEFGLWAAIAIHDTSAVIGASMEYGANALEIATLTKLARALWIIPLVMGLGVYMAYKHKDETAQAKHKYPWFIFGFIAVAGIFTYVPALKPAGLFLERIAQHGLMIVLFLIGAGITRKTLKTIGVRPLIQACVLWLIVSICALIAIKAQIIL